MWLRWLLDKRQHRPLHRAGLLRLSEFEHKPTREQLCITTIDRLLSERQSLAKLYHGFSGLLHAECTAGADETRSTARGRQYIPGSP